MRKRRLFCTIYGWGGSIAIIIGVAVFAIGIWLLVGTIGKNNNYMKTESIVVEIAEVRLNDTNGGKKTRYAEVVEYEVEGKKYRAQNNSYSNIPQDIGKKIIIYYDPTNPEKCMFPSSNYPAVIVVFVLAVCFITVGTVLLRLEIKERKIDSAIIEKNPI